MRLKEKCITFDPSFVKISSTELWLLKHFVEKRGGNPVVAYYVDFLSIHEGTILT